MLILYTPKALYIYSYNIYSDLVMFGYVDYKFKKIETRKHYF